MTTALVVAHAVVGVTLTIAMVVACVMFVVYLTLTASVMLWLTASLTVAIVRFRDDRVELPKAEVMR